MKKRNILRPAVVIVALALSGFAVWKSSGVMESTENLLLLENLEALTGGTESESSGEMIRVRNQSGKCWKGVVTTRVIDGITAYDMSFEESDRWHSCIKISKEQFNRQNQTRPVPWTECQDGDTGKCKLFEKKQEECPPTVTVIAKKQYN